mmetsp:Transcript_15825/g.40849  ORF Transcript_15825/g.40849 Transcript_15825/m.40849 type:complete len:219 (-) Transcript_15825:387-1043(-)
MAGGDERLLPRGVQDQVGRRVRRAPPRRERDAAVQRPRRRALRLRRGGHVQLPHLHPGGRRPSGREALRLEVPALGQAPADVARPLGRYAAELPGSAARLASRGEGERGGVGVGGRAAHVLRAVGRRGALGEDPGHERQLGGTPGHAHGPRLQRAAEAPEPAARAAPGGPAAPGPDEEGADAHHRPSAPGARGAEHRRARARLRGPRLRDPAGPDLGL